MNLYYYFWDGGLSQVHAKDITEAKQLVFDLDRIPYDIMCIPTININMEVDNEDEEDKATKGKKDFAVNIKANAGKAVVHEARPVAKLVI